MAYFSNGSVIVTRKAVTVDHPDGSGDKWRFDIAKYPTYAPLAGYYPVELTGSGTLPDVGALTFDSENQKYTGEYVALPPSRVISFRAFYQKMIASGANMDEIYAAAKTDVKVEQFLDLARNAQEGSTIDLDDAMTIAGLDYLVADANCPSITAAVKTAVLA